MSEQISRHSGHNTNGKGFDPTLPASLYVLRSGCGKMLKVGITKNLPQRLRQVRCETPFSFKFLSSVSFDDGLRAQVAERMIKWAAGYFDTGKEFRGFTEWMPNNEDTLTKILDITRWIYEADAVPMIIPRSYKKQKKAPRVGAKVSDRN